jgi:hypothetical protein
MVPYGRAAAHVVRNTLLAFTFVMSFSIGLLFLTQSE